MYKKYHWPTDKEKKWSQMLNHERKEFAKRAYKLTVQHPDIRYWAIVVKKENTQEHIRSDANKLYNYMIKLLLINEMSHHEKIKFIPDPRTLKVESGNSLHDYIQTELWFTKNVSTILSTAPCESDKNLNVQFSDMLSGIVQQSFEDNKTEILRTLRQKITVKKLYHSQ